MSLSWSAPLRGADISAARPMGWLIALLAGLVTVGAFAPFDVWPLAIIAPAVLVALWRHATPGQAFLTGWLFGLGLMGGGVYWLTISIGIYSHGGIPAGVLLNALLVMIVALYYGAAGWLAVRLTGGDMNRLWFVAPAAWVLMEWLRGWLFTGFPWLNLGAAMVDSPLLGWAPVGGVYLLSLLVMLTVLSLLRLRIVPLLLVALMWALGLLLAEFDFTHADGEPIPVAIAQGNIPQDQKWQGDMFLATLRRYLALTEQAGGARLVIWPETAVPAYAHRVEAQLLEPLDIAFQAFTPGARSRSGDGISRFDQDGFQAQCFAFAVVRAHAVDHFGRAAITLCQLGTDRRMCTFHLVVNGLADIVKQPALFG